MQFRTCHKIHILNRLLLFDKSQVLDLLGMLRIPHVYFYVLDIIGLRMKGTEIDSRNVYSVHFHYNIL